MNLDQYIAKYRDDILPDTLLIDHIYENFPIEVAIKDAKQAEVKTKLREWASENLDNDDYLNVGYRFFFRNDTLSIQFKIACS
jgi:hypothetical protein